MIELFTYDFMQRSLLAAAMVGGLCSVVGVFVVLRGLAFVGAGTAHAAFAGVALGYLMGWPPLVLAIIFGLATVWITGWVEEKGRMKLDVSIGILYTTTMALAILFIGLMKTYNAEVYGYLFGSVLLGHQRGAAHHRLVECSCARPHRAVLEGAVFYCLRSRDGRCFRRASATDIFSSAHPGRPDRCRLAENGRCHSGLCDDPDSCLNGLPTDLQPQDLTLYSIVIGVTTAVAGVVISATWDVPSGPAIVLLATTVFFISVLFLRRG